MSQIIGDTQHVPNVRNLNVTDHQHAERWMPTMQEEFAVIAHLRQWCHLHTVCPLCREQANHDVTRATLESIITGRGVLS